MTRDLEQDVEAETNNAGSEILFKYLASEETTGGRVSSSRRYLQAYQSLTDWVYSSLDIYKVIFIFFHTVRMNLFKSCTQYLFTATSCLYIKILKMKPGSF